MNAYDLIKRHFDDLEKNPPVMAIGLYNHDDRRRLERKMRAYIFIYMEEDGTCRHHYEGNMGVLLVLVREYLRVVADCIQRTIYDILHKSKS